MSGNGVFTVTVPEENTVAIGARRTNVNIQFGQMRDVGTRTYVSSTYAARYNFAVKQYNYYEKDSSKEKRYMRGGRFFLFSIVVIALLITAIVCAFNTGDNKGLVAVPIIISTLYLLITFYNWYIHARNGSLYHEQMIEVSDRSIPDSINKHFVIPIHAQIQDREFLAASNGETTAVITRLRQRYQDLDKLHVMLYDSTYRKKYASFPAESIVHFLLFLSALIVAINQVS